ncbi:TolC family protein [Sungkyunkwania multivorans]|uniref:TolC family protein n=1 Tax=Sungkyunkwania multivorans TaxID=1173618 RepID=A0ABW3CYZ2_9FLAO
MRNLPIIALFILLTNIGIAQERSYTFSLEQAIEFALENNRSVINADRDIEAAKKQKWETTAIGLPQINGAVEYQNFLKQPVSLLPASAFDNRESTIQTVEDFFGLTRTGSPEPADGLIPVVFGAKQSINASATLSQLIFDGSYLVGLQSAKVFLEISENAKEKTDQEVRKAVIAAYGNVLLAEESVKISERNRVTLQKNLDETTKIFENGLGEEESVEQLTITLANVESVLNNAIRFREIAYNLLKITIGASISDKLQLNDNLESLVKENIVLGLLNTDEGIENNIDLKIAKNTERTRELQLKYEKSQALPSLSAFLNGGYQSFADKDFTFFNEGNRWFGSALIGINLNIPIFSSLQRSAKTQRARIAFEQAKTDFTETEQRLQLELEQLKSEYQFTVEQYETAKENLALAERIEKKNQTKFFEGIGSSFELRQAQTQLYTIQQEYLQAMVNVINKKTELETLLNTY